MSLKEFSGTEVGLFLHVSGKNHTSLWVGVCHNREMLERFINK